MHMGDPINTWYSFFLLCHSETQSFNVVSIIWYYLFIVFASFTESNFPVSNYTYCPYNNLSMIFFANNNNMFGCFISRCKNSFTLNCFKIITYYLSFFKVEFDLDGFILVFKFKFFRSTISKIANFQSVKDYTGIFLLDKIFPLIRLCNSSMLSWHLTQLMVLVFT